MYAWDNFIAQQEQEVGAATVSKWLRPLKVLRFDACNLYLEAQDSFQAMWFEEHIRQKINGKLLNNNHKKIRVHLCVANAPTKAKPKSKTKEIVEPRKAPHFNLLFDCPDPNLTFATYTASEENGMALKLLTQITEQPGSEPAAFNPIYLHGPSGSGKTHLLAAAFHAYQEKGIKPLYVRAETFTEHVVSAIRSSEMGAFRNTYRHVDVLLIDNVQVFSKKGATQEEFFHTFNTLHLSGKQIILSANCSPNELEMIEPRLVSRFEWGIVLPLTPPAPEILLSILQKKAESLRFSLHPRVAEFLLETFASSKSVIRALEALVLRSHLHHLQGTLTVLQARHYLDDLIQEESRARLTPQIVVEKVAQHFGIKSEDIMGKAQSRDCALPRQIAMYLCRTHLKLPFMQIGDAFSKDHSTVMTSVKLIQKGLDENNSDISQPHRVLIKKLSI